MERVSVSSRMFVATSILQSGLIAGGRERREGRQTVFFTPLNPFGDHPNEEHPSDDFSKPRKVHTVGGQLLRTPSTGSMCPEHRTKDYDSGTQDLMSSL